MSMSKYHCLSCIFRGPPCIHTYDTDHTNAI